MAPQLVDDAISLFDRFSEATSPDVLRDLIENASWKESLQRFCDTDPECVLKITWSIIEMCSSSNNVTEFENLDLHTPVWPERNSLAPFCQHETEPNEALSTNTTKPIEETIPQTVMDSADSYDDETIAERGRSKPAQHVSFASTILTSQSTSPSPPATDSQTRQIDLYSIDGNQDMDLSAARGLDNGSSPEETPIQERTPRQDITTRQRPSSIRRMNHSLSLSEAVSSPVGTPDQSVIHQTNSIDVLLAACEPQSAGVDTQNAPADMATDQSSPMSTPPAFEAAQSPVFSSSSSYSSISTSTREDFLPNQPTATAAAYQEEEPKTPTSCQVDIESCGAVEEMTNDFNSRVTDTTTYRPQSPHLSPQSSDVQDDVSQPSTPESLADDLVSPRDTAEPLLPCIQVNTGTPSPTTHCASIGAMQVSSASTVNETPSPSAVSDGLSPDLSESSITPPSKLDEPMHVEKSKITREPLTVFVNDAVDTIRGLSQDHTGGPSNDDQLLARDLKMECINTNWSNGANWLRFIEKGNDSRQRLNVSHMITSAGFASWYDSQVAEAQRRKPGLKDRIASNEVMERLMTLKTSPTTSKEVKSTIRSSLRTRVTKGRRLLGLIGRFGFGIIFVKETWELLKARAEEVQAFVDDLNQNTNKLIVLRHLCDQFDEFVEHGRATVASFVQSIRNEACLARLIHWDLVSNDEVNAKLAELAEAAKQEDLSFYSVLKSQTNHEIHLTVTSEDLETLRPETSLSSGIVEAVLHMADKPTNVRIGSTICMGNSKPFAQAQEEITPARVEPNKKAGLVYLFPIDHGKQGFSLLEIDIQRRNIQHFVTNEDNGRTSQQLGKAFRFLKYGQIENVYIETVNVWNSGPLIIRIANLRMFRMSIGTSELDDNSLRLEAIRTLKLSSDDGSLKTKKREYEDETPHEELRRSKRRRL